MSSEDRYKGNIDGLFSEIKRYYQLQKEYVKLDFAEKISYILSILILVFVLTGIGIISLFYLTMSLVHALDHLLGSVALSYLVAGVINILVVALIYVFRRKLIFEPIIHLIAKMFLEDEDEKME